MSLISYYKKHGWIRSAMAVSVAVFFILVAVICTGYFYQKQIIDDQMKNRCEEISASIVGGMTDSLSVGDNDAVRDQFKRLSRVLPEIDVFVYDFKGNVSFSTDTDMIGESFSAYLNDEALIAQNEKMLEAGVTGGLLKKEIDGTPYVGVLFPSRNQEKCYHCHGSSKEIIGGIAVFADNSNAVNAMNTARNISVLVGGIGVLMVVFIIWIIFSRLVARFNVPMKEITDQSESVATFSQDLSQVSSQISESANEGSIMAASTSDAAGEIANNIGNIASASEEVSAQIEVVHKNFDEASSEISSMSNNIGEVSANIGSVAAAAEQMSFAVNTVATAMEQMYASQSEITKSSSQCAVITNNASKEALRTHEIVNNLGEAASQIGDVIDMIKEIAGKTNLLALNAAIEAAGAGDAGKGFAVVANEVKELAKQTSGATEDIRKKVEGMQENTKEAVKAIEAIAKVITEIDMIMSAIASSIEEQTATTNEVTRNVSESAESADSVAKNINLAADKTEEVSDSMAHMVSLGKGITSNFKGTAEASGQIANDVGVASHQTTLVSENAQNLSKMVDTILEGTTDQKRQSDHMAGIAANLKELTKKFRI